MAPARGREIINAVHSLQSRHPIHLHSTLLALQFNLSASQGMAAVRNDCVHPVAFRATYAPLARLNVEELSKLAPFSNRLLPSCIRILSQRQSQSLLSLHSNLNVILAPENICGRVSQSGSATLPNSRIASRCRPGRYLSSHAILPVQSRAPLLADSSPHYVAVLFAVSLGPVASIENPVLQEDTCFPGSWVRFLVVRMKRRENTLAL